MSGEVASPNAPAQVKKTGFEWFWVVKKDTFISDKFVNSKTFSCGLEKQTSWYLELRPRFSCNDCTYVSLYLWPASKPLDQIHTKFKLGLVTKDGKENNNVISANYVFTNEDGRGRGWQKFIKLDSLLDEKNNYFKNDELTIFCDLQMCVEVPSPTFNDDLSEMLDSKAILGFADATLVVQGEELKVHRSLLSLRSPVFRTKFLDNKLRNGRLVIEDLDVNGVKGLLRFLYSGEVKDLSDIAEFVLPAAAKFGVERLKALCELELCDKLNLQNVTHLLKLAELHGAKQLEAHALALTCKNSTVVVEDSGFWQLNENNQKQVVRALVEIVNKAEKGEPLAKRIKLE